MGNLAQDKPDTEDTTATTPPEGGEATNDTGAGTPNVEPNADTQEVEADDTQEVDPRFRKLRAENAERRTKLREAEKQLAEKDQKFQDLMKQLGALTGQDEPEATAEDMLAAAEKRAVEADQKLRTLQEENAVRAAAENTAKSTILPFLRGTGALAALDQTADDYAGQVKALIEQTVQENPEFSIKRVAVSSGNPGTPTSDRSGEALTRADLKNMTSEEIVQADRDGKLDHLKKN